VNPGVFPVLAFTGWKWSMGMPGCSYDPRLSAFHDGELDTSSSADLQRHLPGCAACQRELQAISSASTMLATAPRAEFMEGAMARLRAAGPGILRRARLAQDHGDLPRILPMVRWLCAVAASILIIGAAWLIQTPSRPPTAQIPVPVPTSAWERLAAGDGFDSPMMPNSNGLPHDAVAADQFIRDSLSEVPPL
jgi:anti-sigma factor RsiW